MAVGLSSDGGLGLDTDADLARRAERALGKPAFTVLAGRCGMDGRGLARMGLAWRHGGPEGLDVLRAQWDPATDAADVVDLIKAAQMALRDVTGTSTRVTGNWVTAGRAQLRLGHDLLWYPYAKTLPADVREYPEAMAQSLSQLRLVGVNGPYSVLLGADAYTALAETSDHGYPVLEHVKRLVKDQIIWAPAIAGAFVVTTRGGDFELHIGQDVSIGYLNHNDAAVRLYLQETFTFLLLTTRGRCRSGASRKGEEDVTLYSFYLWLDRNRSRCTLSELRNSFL